MAFTLFFLWNFFLQMATPLLWAKMADTIDRSSNEHQMSVLDTKIINSFEDSEEFKKDTYIKKLNGPIFFGFAFRLDEDLKKITNIKALVIDFENIPYMDQTGLYALKDGISELKVINIDVYLVNLNERCRFALDGVRVIPHEVN